MPLRLFKITWHLNVVWTVSVWFLLWVLTLAASKFHSKQAVGPFIYHSIDLLLCKVLLSCEVGHDRILCRSWIVKQPAPVWDIRNLVCSFKSFSPDFVETKYHIFCRLGLISLARTAAGTGLLCASTMRDKNVSKNLWIPDNVYSRSQWEKLISGEMKYEWKCTYEAYWKVMNRDRIVCLCSTCAYFSTFV